MSSGGMLVTTLEPNDLNLESLRNFDGTTVYAQNKVRGVRERERERERGIWEGR